MSLGPEVSGIFGRCWYIVDIYMQLQTVAESSFPTCSQDKVLIFFENSCQFCRVNISQFPMIMYVSEVVSIFQILRNLTPPQVAGVRCFFKKHIYLFISGPQSIHSFYFNSSTSVCLSSNNVNFNSGTWSQSTTKVSEARLTWNVQFLTQVELACPFKNRTPPSPVNSHHSSHSIPSVFGKACLHNDYLAVSWD